MNQALQNKVLIIFVKYPEPGKVKTRLAEELGEKKAAEVYSLMAETVIGEVIHSESYETAIFFDPPDKEDEIIKWIGDGSVVFFPQDGEALGERMSNAFGTAFSDGARKAVIIGTDCVDVTAETVEEAFDLLGETDVVIGPAKDGGYYLLGLNNHEPALFRDITWSTGLVLDQTVGRINEAGLSFTLLKTLNDIDTAGDLRRDGSISLGAESAE
jgi:rSAM/selenodomain-associated transferase 1